jgi:hypothetical protein
MRVLFLVVVALVVGQVLGLLVAEMKAPDAPLEVRAAIGLFMGAIFAVIFIKNHRAQVGAFEGVRLGDRAWCAALLQKRRSSDTAQKMDVFGTAALEVAVGEPASALARLQRDTTNIGVPARMRAVVEAHAALLTVDLAQHARALASLLDVQWLTHMDVKRYRAYLIARAALSPVPGDLVARADRALREYKDPEARSYLQWVRAHYDVTPFDEHDRSQDMRRAAELAALQYNPALAARVSARAAAREREAAQVGPYRR